ncbi:acetylserotonin O-methyltransferase [Brevibacillus humidisoli]|uniref:acetylserotonin O-methyltransferase n=1 Tax=Brevibacillus humidisoli TaxID=2895522 RepID=UPI001E3975B0|nr:acetylserotonin O-methyltransferase [Brevibacillus humidisoli]UFJ40741.1 acetylserotonin O-methyltransferase [Brevibacillus humidisoli]
MSRQTNKEYQPGEMLFQMILGSWIAQAIHVAAKLGIADLVKEGPQSCEYLASESDCHAPTLYRLLRALSSVGIFEEKGEGVYGPSEMSRLLESDSPGSLRNSAIMYGEEWHRRAWSHLLYSVQTGEPAFTHLHQMNFFDYLAKNEEATQVFSAAMTSISETMNPLIAQNYDFADCRLLVDVGGGHGSLMAAILQAHPHLRGIVYDQPLVADGAKRFLQSAGLDDRCDVQPGSFFESIPAGADTYLLKFVIHDWPDESALTILSNCRKAMSAGANLLLVEQVLLPDSESTQAKWTDLEMLVMVGGKERTEQEFRSLLSTAGFVCRQLIPISGGVAIIQATAV